MSDNAGSKVSFFLSGSWNRRVGRNFVRAEVRRGNPRISVAERQMKAANMRSARRGNFASARKTWSSAARQVASRQKETISAAVDAGRDAYQREKAKAQ